ncbi:MAG: T9SS type A sorting domain-containing protein [Prolixibacteraceae bacterium]|nr:T9SS type A sorting domain-containing protein [Prolixibacteraceae bacterium]
MAKNLASRKLNNGTSIPIHFSPSDYYDPGYKPALYAYGNSSSNFTTYGGLYDWELVWSGKLCPVGWHVPSVDEWETLFNYLGGKNKAGTILKERGFRHWITQNELATDSVGFTALPGGKNTNKEIQYENLGLGAYFWTSDANPLNLANAWFIAIFDDNTPVQIDNYLKNTSSSVRCVYDYEYPVFQNIIDTVICDGTTFNNHDSEGLYRDKFTSAVGYDSVSIINLSFYHSANPEVFISGDTLKSLYVFNNYSWFNINSEIPESYNRNFIIENSGRYYLKVVDEFGCEKTSETIHIYQSAVQDISEDKFSFSVIPNPGNGKFNFKVNSILDESIILKLVNSTGSILFEEKLEPANSVFKSFDLTNVNKGIYYLVIVKGSDKYSEKIIIR